MKVVEDFTIRASVWTARHRPARRHATRPRTAIPHS